MIELRPYQKQILNHPDITAILLWLSKQRAERPEVMAPLVVAPTGSGKTVMFAALSKWCRDHGLRVLIVVHRREIMQQTRSKLYDLGITAGLIAPGSPPTAELVQVAMIQTLVRRLSTVRRPDLIMPDEAHHCQSENSHGRMLGYWSEVPRIGWTATPERLQGEGLRCTFDDLVVGPTVASLVREGFLSYPVLYAPPTATGVQYHVRRGDFDTDEQQRAMSARSIVGDVIEHYRRHFARAVRAAGGFVGIAVRVEVDGRPRAAIAEVGEEP